MARNVLLTGAVLTESLLLQGDQVVVIDSLNG